MGTSAAPVFATAADELQSLLLRLCLVLLMLGNLLKTGQIFSENYFIQAVWITGAKAQTCGIICQLRGSVGPPCCIAPLYFLCLPCSASCCDAA